MWQLILYALVTKTNGSTIEVRLAGSQERHRLSRRRNPMWPLSLVKPYTIVTNLVFRDLARFWIIVTALIPESSSLYVINWKTARQIPRCISWKRSNLYWVAQYPSNGDGLTDFERSVDRLKHYGGGDHAFGTSYIIYNF